MAIWIPGIFTRNGTRTLRPGFADAGTNFNRENDISLLSYSTNAGAVQDNEFIVRGGKKSSGQNSWLYMDFYYARNGGAVCTTSFADSAQQKWKPNKWFHFAITWSGLKGEITGWHG